MSNFYKDTKQTISHLPKCAINNEKAGNEEITPVEQLKELLLPFNKLEDGYAELALAYILTGEDNILDDLDTCRQAIFQDLQASNSYKLQYNRLIVDLEKEISHSFYANLCESFTNEQIIRLGKMLASITILSNYAVYDDSIPKWIICLLKDTLDEGNAKFTFNNLLQLLTADGVDFPEKVLVVLFLERKEAPNKDSWRTFYFRKMNKFADVETFINDNIALYEEHIPHLSETEHKAFLTLLANHPTINQKNPNILAMLCVYGEALPRRKAIIQLENVEADKIQPLLQAYLNNDDNIEHALYALEALVQIGASSQKIIQQSLTTTTSDKLRKHLEIALKRLDFLAIASDYVSNQAILKPLSKIVITRDDDLSLRAMKYVLIGDDVAIVSALSKTYPKIDEDACCLVYDIIFQSLQAEQIIRLGKILTVFNITEKYHRFQENQAPDYMTNLVTHALHNTPIHGTNRDSWSFSALIETFGIVEENPENSLADLFLRGYIYTVPVDTEDFINNHHSAIESVVLSLSMHKQKDFLEKLLAKYPDFIIQHPNSIALLCVSEHQTIRKLAVPKITEIAPENLQPHLQAILKTGKAKEKSWAIDALITIGDSCLSILKQALTTEKTKSVQKNLQQAIQRLTTLQGSKQQAYEIPEFQPMELTQIPDSFIEVMKQNALELYKGMTLEKVDEISREMLKNLNGQSFYAPFKDIATHKNSVQKLPEYGLLQAMALSDVRYYSWRSLEPYVTTTMLETLELRHFQQVLEIFKLKKDCGERDIVRDIADDYLEKDYYRENSYPFFTTEQVVPFFMTYPELISKSLELAPLLKLLTLFPQIPDQYVPKLLEVALGMKKLLRVECQDLLSIVPKIHLQAIESLAHSKAEIRMTAVEWLGRLGQLEESKQLAELNKSEQTANLDIRPEIIQALHALMKTEEEETITTAILSALEKNDDDISVFLTPKALLKEAKKGLKGEPSETFTWFESTLLPTVNWHDGTPVDSNIIQWWAILAEKIKQPRPNELFQKYMNLLDNSSQKNLSLCILQSFINADLGLYSVNESKAIADTLLPKAMNDRLYYNSYGVADTWSSQYPDKSMLTEDIVSTHIMAQLQKMQKGSAIKSKGMLALAHKATGSIVLDLLDNYLKNHPRRNAQIIAFMDALSVSDDPLIIQWMLNISRRYRTKSLQQKSTEIIIETAKRNHWTQHQLADRTIPMAGVDDEGILTLNYDSRNLTAYIDEKYKFVLKNENGKVIKSLPAPRKEDDAKTIKEAKSLFSACKKELKQVIELQSTRLYEAMCSERVWNVADWQEYIFAHPIMKCLVTRLIWLEVDKRGEIVQVFRPSNDGQLLNINDDEITLATDNHVKLAHKVLFNTEDMTTNDACEVWKQHLKDYEIKPLFSQLDNIPPKYDHEAVDFNDFRGYATTTFKLRSAVKKLGYQRGEIGDGGGFKDYIKTYDIGDTDSFGKSLGLVAILNFSGSGVNETDDNEAFLLRLNFKRKGDNSWRPKLIPLAEIPPILLAESYAEYAKLAKGTDGFDADWESRADYC